MPKSGGRTISTASPKFSFRLKRYHKTKEINPGTSSFNTFSFRSGSSRAMLNKSWDLGSISKLCVVLKLVKMLLSVSWLSEWLQQSARCFRQVRKADSYLHLNSPTSQYLFLCVFTYSSFLPCFYPSRQRWTCLSVSFMCKCIGFTWRMRHPAGRWGFFPFYFLATTATCSLRSFFSPFVLLFSSSLSSAAWGWTFRAIQVAAFWVPFITMAQKGWSNRKSPAVSSSLQGTISSLNSQAALQQVRISVALQSMFSVVVVWRVDGELSCCLEASVERDSRVLWSAYYLLLELFRWHNATRSRGKVFYTDRHRTCGSWVFLNSHCNVSSWPSEQYNTCTCLFTGLPSAAGQGK